MKTTYVYIALIVALVAGLIFVRNQKDDSVGVALTPIDVFAQCISDAGAKFYGAYWCPHCQAQKKLFNNSKKLPYVECSTPNGQAQTQVCIDAKITGYPTWIFADGSIGDGEQTFEQLADKTKCVLPE
jgi:thiol-disulfide isomerase/thioredoxin